LNHFCPGWVVSIKALLGVIDPAMIDVDFPDKSPSVTLVINRVLCLLNVFHPPNEEIFVSNLDLATVSNKIEPELALMQIALQADPAANTALPTHQVAARPAHRAWS
jgi:hypothetical protein